MLQRKLLSAYSSSALVILFFALNQAFNQPLMPYAARHFAGWGSVVALYVVPIVFLYGIVVSVLTDQLAEKLRVHRYIEFFISGFIHTLFGFVFGTVFGSIAFCMYGGAAAALFFLADRLFLAVWTRRKKAAVLVTLTVPIVIFAGTAAYMYAAAPPPEPFTEKEAVRFATSGNGTLIDLFPKEAGIARLEIEGHQVERETSVSPAGKDKYEVTFTERWSKEGAAAGQRRMHYLVGRGSMEAHGGDGSSPPYSVTINP